MTAFATLFAAVNAIALVALPRRWATMPLIVGASYMTLGQGVELGPFTFTVIRLLILVGAVRVALRGDRLAGGILPLDWLILAWGGWACLSALFHDPVGSTLVFRLGLVYNAWGIYFLGRVFCTSIDDAVWTVRLVALVLALVAAGMVYEQVVRHNAFSILGGVSAVPEFREGRFRAQGPFAHPILAGTVGAVSLPLMCGLWQYHPRTAALGAIAGATMVVTSASSGPVLATLCGLAGVLMWRVRGWMRVFRWLALLGYIALDLVMKAPAYYLASRIDVVGGSSGWYRARLIESGIEHLNEWWLVGTDNTRHWMATGVMSGQADIVNHYLQVGVWGGLPLVVLLLVTLGVAFARVGKGMPEGSGLTIAQKFLLWTLGASLASHAAAWMSVSYFDQTVVFLYLTLAIVGSWPPTAQSAARKGVHSPAFTARHAAIRAHDESSAQIAGRADRVGAPADRSLNTHVRRGTRRVRGHL